MAVMGDLRTVGLLKLLEINDRPVIVYDFTNPTKTTPHLPQCKPAGETRVSDHYGQYHRGFEGF